MRILLIEDHAEDVRIFRQALAAEPELIVDLQQADRLSTGLAALDRAVPDVVLLDLGLPDSQGLQTLLAVHQRAPRVPIVILTASDDAGLALLALQHGAQDYLVKGYVQVYRKLLGRSLRYAIERKRAEVQLRHASAQTEQLLALLPSILIRVDLKGCITHWNAVAESTFGIRAADVINRPLASCGVQWDLKQIESRIAESLASRSPLRLDDVAFTPPHGRPALELRPFTEGRGECGEAGDSSKSDSPKPPAHAGVPGQAPRSMQGGAGFTHPDAHTGYVGITIIPMRNADDAPTGVLLFGSDITKRKEAEEEQHHLQDQLHQAQKMEIVGRFAGGIAHDFNNFLQVILGFTWLIRRRHPEHQQLLSDLQEITHAADSASALVRQLLTFSRRHPVKPQVLELNQVVRGMERQLQQLVGESIHLMLQLSSVPLYVKVDSTGLEQILMNLSANARDAMPGEGTLTVATVLYSKGGVRESSQGLATEGAYVRLSIRDTGAGMDPEVAQHVFEPFFTTKQVGKGTGLGLAVVYGLMRQHGGLIDIETAPGCGSAFHLYFPVQKEPATPSIQPSSGAAETSTLPPRAMPSADGAPSVLRHAQTKHILIVDDDEAVRVFCERLLREQYTVTTVSSAVQALDALGQYPYDLLLTDIAMSGMDGFQLIERVTTLRPHVKIIAMSGFLTEEMEQRLRRNPLVCEVLRKPVTPTLLQVSIDRQWQR